ncbi:hypothetical protein D3C87_917830 [compost metagenome]
MAKKKVVDADILLEKIQSMSYRAWVNTPYYSGSGYGTNNIEDAMRNAAQMMTSQIAQNVNAALTTMLIELKMAVEAASRDEDGGMCGLCRVNPDEILPVDYRPPKDAA